MIFGLIDESFHTQTEAMIADRETTPGTMSSPVVAAVFAFSDFWFFGKGFKQVQDNKYVFFHISKLVCRFSSMNPYKISFLKDYQVSYQQFHNFHDPHERTQMLHDSLHSI